MLEYCIISLAAFIASFVGSLNGLGVAFIITLFLSLLNKGDTHSYLWLPYLSTFIVSLIFILTRPALIIKNVIPIFFICCLSASGLIFGKLIIFSVSIEKLLMIDYHLSFFKIGLGILILIAAFFYGRIKTDHRPDSNTLLDQDWNLSFEDTIVFFLIGICAGTFDFSIAAIIYSYLLLNKSKYNMERLDVCVYSVLVTTSLINFISALINHEATFPELLNIYYFLFLILGAVFARLFYKFLLPEYKRKLILTALYLLGLKLILFNVSKHLL
jgi:uncharacterized membrane protein YfcA